MTPTKTAAILRRLADDWRHEELQLCKQFGDVIPPRSMRARMIKDTEAIDAAVEMIDRLETAEQDALEQARLNGMGAERELALMAKLEAAEKSDAESLAMYRRARDERDALRAENEALAANLRGKHSTTGATYAHLIEDRDALRAKIEAMGRLVALPDRITPEQAPPEIVEYAPIAAEGYADGWNACIRTMLAAAPKPEAKP